MSDVSEILAGVKIDIGKARIIHFQELRGLELNSPNGRQKFLEFCHIVVEGGVLQYVFQPAILVEVIKKVQVELEDQSQLISEAVLLAENLDPFRELSQKKKVK